MRVIFTHQAETFAIETLWIHVKLQRPCARRLQPPAHHVFWCSNSAWRNVLPGHALYSQSTFNAEGPLMKGFQIAAAIIAGLYIADEKYAQGKYTYALQHMVTQMRHSFGV
jgi:hypothetical protein